MVFLELAAQSVTGFSPSVRVQLKPGYVLLQGPGPGVAPLAGLVESLLFPDGRGSDVRYRAAGAQDAKVGLALGSRDKSLWRLVRSLGGEGGLYRLVPPATQFELVSQDAVEIASALRAALGLPDRTQWAQFFALSVAQLPSAQMPIAAGPVAQDAPKKLPTSAWEAEMKTVAAAPVIDVKALEAELVQARRAAQLQFEIDGFSAELDTLARAAAQEAELTAKVAQTRQALAQAQQSLLGLPQDIVARSKKLPEERKRIEEQLGRIEHELQTLSEQAAGTPLIPWKDARFLIGLGLGALLLGVGAMAGPAFRAVALLALGPFSWAAFLALRFIEALQQVGRSHGKHQLLNSRAAKLNEEISSLQAVVDSAFAQLQVTSSDEFHARLGRPETLRQQLASLEKDLAALVDSPERAAREARRQDVMAAIDARQKELLQFSNGYLRDVRDIENDLEQLQQARPVPPPRLSPPVVASAAKPASGGFSAALMNGAAELLREEVAALGAALQPRAAQYLAALTERRLSELRIGASGQVSVLREAQECTAEALDARDRDLLFLALRLALAERVARRHPLPVIVEDTFGPLLGALHPLFKKMLKHVGSLTQVMHVSALGQNADAVDTPLKI